MSTPATAASDTDIMSDVAQDAEENSQAATLVTLPNELLLEILQDLPPIDLYHLAWTCRTLHDAALTRLFREFSPRFLTKGALYIRVNHPKFLLPAIHGARFVKDFRRMMINFPNELTLLTRDLRILKDILTREETKVQSLTLRFQSRQSFFYKGMPELEYADAEVFLGELRDILDLAVMKGCTTLSVQSETSVRDFYTRPVVQKFRPASLTTRRPAPITEGPGFFFSIWNRLSIPLLGSTTAISPGSTSDSQPNEAPGETTAGNTQREAHPQALVRKIHPSAYKDAELSTISLHSLLFLEEPMRQWTFDLLNHAPIDHLRIDQDAFRTEVFGNSLSSIQMTDLSSLTYTCTRPNTFVPEDFFDFLTRHATKLSTLDLPIALHFQVPPFHQEAAFERGKTPSPMAKLKLALPSVQRLGGPLLLITWILRLAMNHSKSQHGDFRACFPLLERLELMKKPRGLFADLDWAQVDDVLARLVAIATDAGFKTAEGSMGRLSMKWLRTLEIDCDDGPNNFCEWMKRHFTTPDMSSFKVLGPRVHSLVLYKRYPAKMSDVELDLIPDFLVLFPNLFTLEIRLVPMKKVQGLGAKYWNRVKVSCPALKDMMFNWAVELTVDQALRNEWPDIPSYAQYA